MPLILLIFAAAAASPARFDEQSATPEANRPEALGAALAEASRAGVPAGFRLFQECFDGPEFLTVEVFGDGVGIWEEKRQFEASSAALRELAQALSQAGFAGMEAVYGGEGPRPEPPAVPPGSAAALEMLCRLQVSIGGASHQVVQLSKGERSQAFAALAHRLLEILRPEAAEGVEIADLGQGLAGLAEGRLDPRTFRLTAHCKPGPEDEGAPGYLLRVAGRQVTSRPYAPATGYGDTQTAELSAAALRSLAGDLAGLRVWALPKNLFFEGYVDLEIRVLDQRVATQARRFAGRGGQAPEELRASFGRLLDILHKLHLETLSNG